MRHDYQDRVSLALARRIAAELSHKPELIELARENLDRWSERNGHVPSLLRCYAEWRSILERPLPEIIDTLTAPTDEGQRLRQNSPFPGVLSPRQVWEIKRRERDGPTTT
jgi:hypothetical protein